MSIRFTTAPCEECSRTVMYLNLARSKWAIPAWQSNAFYGVMLDAHRGSRTAAFESLKESRGWQQYVVPKLRAIAGSDKQLRDAAYVYIIIRVRSPRSRRFLKTFSIDFRARQLRNFVKWIVRNYPELESLNEGEWIKRIGIILG